MFSTTILKVLLSALAILSLSGPAIASPHKLKRHEGLMARTNAERMALGQPPLPPRSMSPTKASLVARTGNHGSQPSGSPSLPKRCILVRKKNGGAFVGYISRDFVNNKGTYNLKNDDDECLKVLVPNSQSLFDLEINNASGSEKYLGIAASNNGASYALPVKAAQSSVSVTNKNSNENETPYSQSAIWSKSGMDGLLASWRNGNGQTNFAKTYIRSGGTQRQLYFAIGNFNYNDATEVVLTFVNP